MRTSLVRRIAIAMLTLAILVTFAAMIRTAGSIGSAEIALAGGAFVFGFVVLRLVETMLTSDKRHARRARRALIMASMIPAIVLVPSALESSSRDIRLLTLLVAVMWIGIAASFTWLVLNRAGHLQHPRPARSRYRLTRDQWLVPIGALPATVPVGQHMHRGRRAHM